MTIVGGGYVAAEFAHVFSALGTQVTQVHRGPALLSHQDEDVSRTFTELAGRQWDVRLDTVAQKVRSRDDVDGACRSPTGPSIETDVLLMATGRVPNADRLGLENTSIEVADGRVVVDEYQRTTVEGVWALGDVSSDYELKHVANHEAARRTPQPAAPRRPGGQRPPVRARARCSPRRRSPASGSPARRPASRASSTVAVVARLRRHRLRLGHGEPARASSSSSSSATPDGEQLLGAHIIGPQASLLLQPLVQAHESGHTIARMARNQYWIHPVDGGSRRKCLVEIGRLKLIAHECRTGPIPLIFC